MKQLSILGQSTPDTPAATTCCSSDSCCEPAPVGIDPGAADATPAEERTVVRVDGMDCASCALTLERTVTQLAGVRAATVNFAAARLSVEHDSTVGAREIDGAVQRAGFRVASGSPADAPSIWQLPRARMAAASGLLFLIGLALVAGERSAQDRSIVALFLAAIAIGGFPIFRAAWAALRARHMDMNVLMSAATIGAALIGEWPEAAAVVVLFSAGNLLQSWAIERTRGAVSALAQLAPAEVLVRRDGADVVVAAAAVVAGEHVVVRPGERIAVDGAIIEGATTVDESPITGESIPVEKATGDRILSGSLNGAGSIVAVAEHSAEDSTLQQIVRLVEQAQASKAPSEQFVDRFSRIYTPIVVAVALALIVVPLLFGGDPDTWVYRGLALLIIACPCSLVISTPVTVVSGIGAASRRGILIKGGEALEAAGRLRAIAMDKTGTLTEGRSTLASTATLGVLAEADALLVAAALERRSEHPLAHAILTAANGRALPLVERFTSIPGRGAEGDIDGTSYLIGSPRLFQERGISLPEQVARTLVAIAERGETPVILGTPHEALAIFGLADTIRTDAPAAIAQLRATGVEEILMLTGDSEGAARRVADELGIDYRAQLLPQQKVEAVQELVARHGVAGMVGDGVNDAPALAAASVSFAMGAAGSGVALETADVALMQDDLRKLAASVRLSHAAERVLRQNVIASILIKGAFVLLAPFGLVALWVAVLADLGTSLAVTANGLRLFRHR